MPLLGSFGAGSGRGFGQNGAVSSPFIVASGGTETTDGDYKIHTFTASGCFVVSSAGTPTCCGGDGSYVDYLVVASGGNGSDGGGGGGGTRSVNRTYCQASNSAGSTPTSGILVSEGTYPIVVGSPSGTRGGPSSFGGISTSGGGEGGGSNGGHGAFPGGSGGGGGHRAGSGAGNIGGYSPPEGQNGGGPIGTAIHNNYGGAGGGGLTGAGQAASGAHLGAGGVGGNGGTFNINGTSTIYAAGGAGTPQINQPGIDGGGPNPATSGAGGINNPGSARGLDGRGSGGAGSSQNYPQGPSPTQGGAGTVIIRYKIA